MPCSGCRIAVHARCCRGVLATVGWKRGQWVWSGSSDEATATAAAAAAAAAATATRAAAAAAQQNPTAGGVAPTAGGGLVSNWLPSIGFGDDDYAAKFAAAGLSTMAALQELHRVEPRLERLSRHNSRAMASICCCIATLSSLPTFHSTGVSTGRVRGCQQTDPWCRLSLAPGFRSVWG